MKAITREEKIMSGENLTPITRKEMFLAKLIGKEIETPFPITRMEKIMNGDQLTPITREEMFLAKSTGQDIKTPTPTTRREMFLSKIGGGSGGEETKYYIVNFYNGDELLQSVSVPQGGNAFYTGDTPVSSEDASYEFLGWEPTATNVTGDLDCYAQFKAPKSLNDSTWAEIADISKSGQGANYFSIGDTKAVALNGTVGTLALNETYYVYILGFDHNSEIEGTGITFGTFKTARSDGLDICLIDDKRGNYKTDGSVCFNINHSDNTNAGGWQGCDMRYDILGSVDVKGAQNASENTAINPVANTLMAALPADLRAVMKPIIKYTNNTGGTENTEDMVTATVDYLPLLAEFEVFHTRSYANTYEQNYQKRYAYFVAGNSAIKTCHSSNATNTHWWLRSMAVSTEEVVCCYYKSSKSHTLDAYYSMGIAPIFLV